MRLKTSNGKKVTFRLFAFLRFCLGVFVLFVRVPNNLIYITTEVSFPQIKCSAGCFANLQWIFNPTSANPTIWSNTLRQFIGNSRQIV